MHDYGSDGNEVMISAWSECCLQAWDFSLFPILLSLFLFSRFIFKPFLKLMPFVLGYFYIRVISLHELSQQRKTKLTEIYLHVHIPQIF